MFGLHGTLAIIMALMTLINVGNIGLFIVFPPPPPPLYMAAACLNRTAKECKYAVCLELNNSATSLWSLLLLSSDVSCRTSFPDLATEI